PVMNNRLPGCGRDRYGYNEWGELTTRRDQQLEWNAQGQLTRVISGNTETHYGYDALGRRIRKATYGRHTGHTARSRTDFVWEGFRLLQENVQQQGWRTYLYDAEQPYTPVASVTGKGESRQVWYYHTDVTGTPQEVTAADGTLVWAGYIRGFGENAADISNSGAYFHQPLRLPGQYFDDETGLHYNLFRYYAPECGRFVSQDPIGLAGGLNLYAYAPNPLNWIDPLGLSACAPTHHLATNKHSTWSDRFRELFKKNDLGKFKNGKWRKDVLNDPLNRIDVPGHKGPHPDGMHQEIFDRLSTASDRGKDAFRKEIEKLRVEAVTPGSWLNDILTKVNK
ncbi:RHS domain-containing protein, partial [Salmonella enterica]|nr:RHS domain-containing protein [Salmonella enterica]ELV7962713.1 RHS domain-containing protein [Salmonella enterica]ELY9680018.1 RHS domain-containing protein [Salmonella enterica]